MSTLMIKDLAITEALDRKAMSLVRGGTGKIAYPYWSPQFSLTKNDFSFDASQLMSQTQNTVVNNGNNVAFADGISATVNPHQNGKNTINFM
ncbi:MAG TPA: hypothetical protein VGE12_03865 [Noviherbaspirillum sp.]